MATFLASRFCLIGILATSIDAVSLGQIGQARTLPKRDGICGPQAAGAGPIASPDTPAAFSSDLSIRGLATNASTSYGYSTVFTNLNGSISAQNYMGVSVLDSYDVLTCASKCDQASGCQAFNVYVERDPSLEPHASECPDPPSTTNFICTLWGMPVTAEQATNDGQYRASFHVLIAGSNAYNKDSPPASIGNFTGPTALGGAIQAPLDIDGHDTYMGSRSYSLAQNATYSPQVCAKACTDQSDYNREHPNFDGSFQTCVFFNSYVLSMNAVPQSFECALYNESWSATYATNYGQYRGSDRYTISSSYSYQIPS